jgi:hypothetical protein
VLKRLVALVAAIALLAVFAGPGVLDAATTPEMTSPAPNSALTGSSVTFQWSAGTNVQEYTLWVGNSPGSAHYFILR